MNGAHVALRQNRAVVICGVVPAAPSVGFSLFFENRSLNPLKRVAAAVFVVDLAGSKKIAGSVL
jgi:hypothetical protein